MQRRDIRRREDELWGRFEEALMTQSVDRPTWRTYTGSLVALGLLSVVLIALRSSLGIVGVAMLYLLFCLLTAMRAGRGPAILVAAASSLLFNFFFLPPYYTLSIDSTDHWLALLVFLIVALVTSNLTADARTRARIAEQEQARSSLLFRLNEGLVTGRSLAEILETIVQHVVHVYGASQAAILMQANDEKLIDLVRFPPGPERKLTRNELAVARLVLQTGEAAGLGTSRVRVLAPHGISGKPSAAGSSGQDVLFLPIRIPHRDYGVLEVQGRPNGGHFDETDRDLLGSLADQAALALDRVRLTDEAARSEVLERTNELQSALLAAVSHDLRTPLAAIKTSATSLLDQSVSWDEESRQAFLEAIDEETDRLTMMVRNLLDLSRIEGGALRPDRDWNDPGELLHDIALRFRSRAGSTGHNLTLRDTTEDLAYFDYVELDQVMSNLVENSLKYTPSGTTIELAVDVTPTRARFSVSDDGPGIAAGEADHIFEKFYRSSTNSRVPGTGIGLAIARGLVEAHGGRLWFEPQSPGVRFIVEVPQPPVDIEETAPP